MELKKKRGNNYSLFFWEKEREIKHSIELTPKSVVDRSGNYSLNCLQNSCTRRGRPIKPFYHNNYPIVKQDYTSN